MSAVFAIRVQTGREVEAKQLLQMVLDRAGDKMVKSVYAMESMTQVLTDAQEEIPSELSQEDIPHHLHLKRLNEYLNNLRTAYTELKRSKSSVSLDDLESSYKESIRQIQSLIQKLRKKVKGRMRSVLPGYILVELNVNYHTLPAQLWHLIKSVPKVIGVVSRNHIPKDQLEHFFEIAEVERETEVQVSLEDEIHSVEDRVRELLHQANTTADVKEKKQRFEAVEEDPKTMVERVNDIKESVRPNNRLQRLIQRSKAFVRRGKETFVLPIRLIEKIRNDKEAAPYSELSVNELISGIIGILHREVQVE
ncbi:hypothetical protein GCM10007416_05250 [Kroppenstedtia guangzhouensis]|uniref:NusG-like N-terminal domain-containing protein n=1 Tax=Kroppenstedtia guangzhouensis TaxID=1274356 RepID=A0ABQ1G2C3_9BACL|nr:transcription termination/antitermination NusG family protein [Kroppenstedtia guangzhouensis]GGA35371.1 hypothetical protein GCM10007416_05250 [Kroppenstedtia guangzhouensis]